MTAKPLLTTSCLLFLSVSKGLAQAPIERQEVASDSWKEHGVAVGINYSRFLFAEIGHYRSYVYRMGVIPTNSTTMTYGAEVSYLNGLVVAPKVQARIHLLFIDLSVAPILYTDFRSASLKIRPEIGFGNQSFDLNYGYNAGIINDKFEKFNRHVFALRYYYAVKIRNRRTFDHKGKPMR